MNACPRMVIAGTGTKFPLRFNFARAAGVSSQSPSKCIRKDPMSSKNTLKKITVAEIMDLKVKAFKDIEPCRLSLIQIGKRFLSHALEIDVYKMNFSDVRGEYLKSSGKSEADENEGDFYKSIAKQYCHLTSEPKEKLLEVFYRATDDVRKIDSQLIYIELELKKLEDKKRCNGWLNGEDRYNRNLLEYYRDKNKSAKEEILNFISKDIEYYAYNQCQESILGRRIFGGLDLFFQGSMPYKYSRFFLFNEALDSYDVRNLTEMSSKFLDLPIPTYREIKKLYENDKKEFYNFASDYISGDLGEHKNAMQKISECIGSNHIIANRKDVLQTIMIHYEKRDFISVVSMLPMQIEGIFHDVCLEIGIDESKLDISSLNEKLRIIESHINHFIYFEYFSFKFPVIRNLVAHGKLLESNIEHTAIMLMLDLLPVCELACSEEIPVNRKLKLLDAAVNNDFDSLLKMVDCKDLEIPSFYNRNNDLYSIQEKYESDKFWSYLTEKLKKESIENINQSEIMKQIKRLHASKLCQKESSKFLKEMPNLIKKMKDEKLEREKKLETLLSAIKRTNK